MALRSLVPWRKEEPFMSLQKAMNELFEDFVGEPKLTPLAQERFGWLPSIDVAEDDKEFKITAELPGMEQKDIDVYLANQQLTIKGDKKEEHEEKRRNYYRRERVYGAFHRVVPLPVEIDATKVAATFKNGVLVITLPKTVEAQKTAKRIEVKTT